MTWLKAYYQLLSYDLYIHLSSKSINKDSVIFKFQVSQILSVPRSDSCTQLLSQEKESFSARVTCPSACSKRCGSFFPEVPAHESTCLLQENVTCTILLLLEIQLMDFPT